MIVHSVFAIFAIICFPFTVGLQLGRDWARRGQLEPYQYRREGARQFLEWLNDGQIDPNAEITQERKMVLVEREALIRSLFPKLSR